MGVVLGIIGFLAALSFGLLVHTGTIENVGGLYSLLCIGVIFTCGFAYESNVFRWDAIYQAKQERRDAKWLLDQRKADARHSGHRAIHKTRKEVDQSRRKGSHPHDGGGLSTPGRQSGEMVQAYSQQPTSGFEEE